MSDQILPHGIGSGSAKLSLATCGNQMRYVMRTVDPGGGIAEVRPVLQQLWSITETEGGYPIKGRTEWRDVPLVTE